MKKSIPMIIATAIMVVLSGCGKPEVPEVNDENCAEENVLKIKDEEVQKKLRGLCMRRSRFVPSQERYW